MAELLGEADGLLEQVLADPDIDWFRKARLLELHQYQRFAWQRTRSSVPDATRRPYLPPSTASELLARHAAGEHRFPGVQLAGADLRDADLRGVVMPNAVLRGANCAGADLSNAILMGADLTDACLQRANLSFADLRESCLRNCDLSGCDFVASELFECNMIGANLSEARLYRANLSHTLLDGAQIHGALFSETALVCTSLAQVRGLSEARHVLASSICIDTIKATAEQLRDSAELISGGEDFLRALGVPDEIVEVYRTWARKSESRPAVFISYSHRDSAFATRLYESLNKQGIRCWLDTHDLKCGERILDGLQRAIRDHDKVLLCCSASSLRSTWVEDEITMAFEKERETGNDCLIPLNLDGFMFTEWRSGQAPRVRARRAVDFVNWSSDEQKYARELGRLMTSLSRPATGG